MIKIIASTALLLLSVASNEKHEISSGDKHYKYETSKGMFNGEFTSYYPNGNIKAEGNFISNQKVGKWTIYDESGKIALKRNYINNYNFTDNTNYSYQLEKDENNLAILPKLSDKNIVWSKRLWKDIPNNENNLFLYKENNTISTILSVLKNDDNKLTIVSTNDEYREEISFPKEITSGDIISLKIKEDSFYDKSIKAMQSRIVSLGLVDKNNTVYWIYYPSLREFLNTPLSSKTKRQEYITTLDDIFLFNHFQSDVYKESNVYDKSLDELYQDESTLLMKKTLCELDAVDIEFVVLNQQFKSK